MLCISSWEACSRVKAPKGKARGKTPSVAPVEVQSGVARRVLGVWVRLVDLKRGLIGVQRADLHLCQNLRGRRTALPRPPPTNPSASPHPHAHSLACPHT